MSDTVIVLQTTRETIEVNTPGVPGPSGSGSINLRDLNDVTGSPPNTGEAPVWDGDSFELTDVLTAAEAAAGYQPLDSDLTAIAALATTSFGRGLLILANQAALLSAAGAAAVSHTHAESDITNLVTDLAGKQPLDSDLTAIAALTTTSFGRAFLAFADEAAFKAGVNLEAGTDFPSQATFDDHSARHEAGGADEVTVTVGQMDAEASTDGQVPTSDGLGGVAWQDQVGGGGGASALVDLTDVTGGPPNTGEAPVWDGDSFEYTDVATQAELDAAIAALAAIYEAIDGDLTDIAALAPTNDDVMQRKAGHWVNRTLAQLISDLAALGTTFQPLDSDLTAIAALTTTSFGRSLLTEASASAARTDLGLVIGTDVEAHDADLTTIAGLTPTNDDLIQRKAGAWTNRTMAQLIADLAALGTTFQPLDSDLTSIAALSTTTFGRALLTLADPADATKFLDGTGAYDTVKDSDLSTSDITTNDVSTTKHGFAPKAPNDATKYLDGTGAYSVPAGGGGGAEDPVQDVLGTPDTAFEFESSSLTGLTVIGSPDTEDADTTVPGNYYVSDNDNSYVGRYVGSLTAPFTVVTELERTVHFSDGSKAGVFVGDSSPSLSADADVLLIGNSSGGVWVELAATTNVYSGFGIESPLHCYLAIRVNSSSDVDYLYSQNGRVWTKLVDSRNPGLGTLASCGICIASAGGTLMSAAFKYLRVWNSAKAFPGAVA